MKAQAVSHLDVVEQEPVRSQNNCVALSSRGFDITQATLSRDNELGLLKRSSD